MKFELNEYKKCLTDKEILDNIKSVANSLKTDYISISQYKTHGAYSQTAIQGHFGTWKNALHLAGLRTAKTSAELKLISDEKYFADLRRVALFVQKNTVSYADYQIYGQYSANGIFERFGKWNIALQKAGLTTTGFSKDKITEQQCFEEIERIWSILGRQPTSTDIIKGNISVYSIDTYKRRFGGWRKALEAFVRFVSSSHDEEININTDKTVEEACSNNESSPDEQDSNTVVYKQRRTSRNINVRLRFRVLQRDNFKCCACGASPAKDVSVELHVDHILPWSKGGETVFGNLQTLCSKCNLGKSDME